MAAPNNSSTEPLPDDAVEGLRRARAAAPSAALIVYHRDGAAVVPLRPGSPVVVGRASPADLVIEDTSLSRVHARFSLEEGHVVFEDLGSTNGSWVAGVRISRAIIELGDDVYLGAVTASVRAFDGPVGQLTGVESHETFVRAVEAEIVRARHFVRTTAVVLVRGWELPPAPLARWCPDVQRLLRPVDTLGMWGPECAEILLAEADAVVAMDLARRIVAASSSVVCGVALFPDAAGSAEKLIEAARAAALSARSGAAVVSAPSEGAGVPLSAPAEGAADSHAPIAESPGFRVILDGARRIASSNIPVLFFGETGVGKEVAACEIHRASARRDKPLVFVNCGAIPSQLVESTLFGHERGAFTGALTQHRGIFEAAQGGMVLLDEIGELPLPAQAALLRVLETKRVTRVGGTKEIEVDVRVLAATHRDLEAMCQSGAFRVDLLFRLNAMTLNIPPLRDRAEDLLPLALRFLANANRENGRELAGFEPDVLELFRLYRWPGNVRELKNAVDRAVVIARGDWISIEDLPDRVRASAEAAPHASASANAATNVDDAVGGSLRASVQRLETQLILEALKAEGFSQTAAARRLEMPLRTLIHKMKAYGIRKLGYADPA